MDRGSFEEEKLAIVVLTVRCLVILLLYGSNYEHWNVNAALARAVEGLNNVICLDFHITIRELCAVTDGNLKGVIVNLLRTQSKLIGIVVEAP